jgi:hypothetical protein
MKNRHKQNVVLTGILSFLLCMSGIPVFAQTNTVSVPSMHYLIDFSEPVLITTEECSMVKVTEATGVLTIEGGPELPVFSKTVELPLGSEILSVELQPAAIQQMISEKQITPVPTKQQIGDQLVPVDGIYNQEIYESPTPYPSSWYTVSSGAGLNNTNDHTLFVTVRITPVRYLPESKTLLYSTQFTLDITYRQATPPVQASADSYSLVIIAPSEFAEHLLPLVDHKNTYEVSTIFVPLEEIYSSYYGRDDAERIKYFIKHAVEDWCTLYVLLVGDIKKTPIRITHASWWERDLLSDLYYADIYNAQGEFCSWDANDNDRFGEINDDGYDIDGVDLYADVHLGRLACVDETEVQTVVDKIITYEQETYDQIWFQRLICAGGDTFPVSMGAPPFVYEGEITNIKVCQTMPDFEQTILWTSKYNLHPSTFNRAINRGAGFVSYAGHGFEHGWGTSRPNALTKIKIFYYTPYINGLKNGYKLPIIFFDACLTAKLDFNVSDLQHYYPRLTNLLVRLFSLSSDTSDFYQCFAWSFLAKQGGGAIATIGSTRTAYTWVDANGVYGGAGYLDVHFFDSYEQGITVGKMLTGSQNAYIQNVGADYFTLEEFILLGDPSLKTGGFQ